jgi:glycosyltransferase involved in cell wall biosynthesis
MNNPVISVIIPCFNYGHYLEEAVRSVLIQTEVRWECIIVNDGSTDITEEVSMRLAGIDQRIKYFAQSNKGPSAARNLGLLKASGKYIQFLDADDILARDKLRHHAAILNSHEDIDLVYGDVKVFQSSINESGVKDFKYFTQQLSGHKKVIIDELVKDSMFLINTAFFRKSLIDKAGYFNNSISRHEDWHLWLRGAMKGAYFYYDTNQAGIVWVRAHENSLTGDHKKMWEEKIKARTDLNVFVENNRNDIDSALRDYFERKNTYFLLVDSYKYELLYGSIFKGFCLCFRAILISGKAFCHLYESLHWVKERYKRIS